MTEQNDNPSSDLLYYQAFLVRMWKDSPAATWRASARSVQSDETVRFTNLEALFTFLEVRASDTTTLTDNDKK